MADEVADSSLERFLAIGVSRKEAISAFNRAQIWMEMNLPSQRRQWQCQEVLRCGFGGGLRNIAT